MNFYPKLLLLMVVLSGTLIGCKQKNQSDKKTDLMKYGIPVSIDAPSDVEISKLGSGRLADVSLKNQNGYDIQIFMAEAFSNDLTKLKQQKKETVTANPFFSKIVEEYPDGFLYEKITNEDTRNYDFIIIKVMGDKEINFQCGNSKEFSEQEVKNMIHTIRK